MDNPWRDLVLGALRARGKYDTYLDDKPYAAVKALCELTDFTVDESLEYKIGVMQGCLAGKTVHSAFIPHPGKPSISEMRFIQDSKPIWDWYNFYYRLED